jgi:hypothetical protein
MKILLDAPLIYFKSPLTMQNDKANIEAKAKLFSLYLGQPVLIPTLDAEVYPNEITGEILDKLGTIYLKESALLLRSVKQLTDEEVINIAIIVFGSYPNNTQKIFIRDGVENMFKGGWGCDLNKTSKICDYLRGIGILLPFTTLTSGDVKTYSEDEILDMGWAKYQKD